MKQTQILNTKYEILTPNGWENFEGVIKNTSAKKEARKITFADKKWITATLEHKFYDVQWQPVECQKLQIGDKVQQGILKNSLIEIVDIEQIILEDTFDIFNAENHIIVVNENVAVHQCDEFSFVQPNIARDFWTSLSPTLSTGGKCIITTTPNTDEDQFAEIWFGAIDTVDDNGVEQPVGKNGFKAYKATWDAHPERDQAWADAELQKIGVDRFEREHNCSFVTFEEVLIPPAKIAQMRGVDPISVDNKVRWYKEINPKSTYVVGYDPSMGTGGDPAAIQVFELETLEQVAEWSNNKTLIEYQVKRLQEILKTLEAAGVTEIFWSLENNSVGEAALLTIREVGEDFFPGEFIHEPRKAGSGPRRKGFTTTNRSKLGACSKFKSWIESDKMTIHSRNLISELKTFVARNGSYEAKIGSHDDLVMATLLCVRIVGVVAQWDDAIMGRLAANFGDTVVDEDDEDSVPMPMFF